MTANEQIDNADVRVTRWTLSVGEDTGPHRHEYDYVVVPLAAGRMQIVDAGGTKQETVLRPGDSYFRTSGSEHNVTNEGPELVDFVEVELVRPAGGRSPVG